MKLKQHTWARKKIDHINPIYKTSTTVILKILVLEYKENIMSSVSKSGIFRKILVVIKQTAFEEYSQVGDIYEYFVTFAYQIIFPVTKCHASNNFA